MSENFRLRRKFDECSFIFPHAPMIPITLVSFYSPVDPVQSDSTEYGEPLS